MNKEIIFGYPGTGKTYTLMKKLESFLISGIEPDKVCFCTYTRSAAEEIKNRSLGQFNFKKEDIPYFGTIHSICFRRFCGGKEVVKPSHLKKFFLTQHIEFQESADVDEDILIGESYGNEIGNKCISFYNLLRITECIDFSGIRDNDHLKDIYSRISEADDFIKLFVSHLNLYDLLAAYEDFKNKNNLIDFVDMLLIAYKSKWVVPTDILIVDEAQDMSPLQWKIYEIWCSIKKEVILAGDDDQSIYSFNGADFRRFLEEQKIANKTTILPVTKRISKNIHSFVLDWIDSNIVEENRVKKVVTSEKEGGEVIEKDIEGLEEACRFLRPGKKTFMLFRTNNYKKQFINEILIPQGIIYQEIRGQGLWNKKSINLFNAIIKLSKRLSVNSIELSYLIDTIPAKFKLMKRGLKGDFETYEKKESYNVSNLIELGFYMNLFDYLNEDYKLFDLINLKENQKNAFLAAKKEVISIDNSLFLGTIHSSKGREADDVILFKDVTKKIAKEITKERESWENEMRVFHVGQSRAKERLIILRGGFEYSEPKLIP